MVGEELHPQEKILAATDSLCHSKTFTVHPEKFKLEICKTSVPASKCSHTISDIDCNDGDCTDNINDDNNNEVEDLDKNSNDTDDSTDNKLVIVTIIIVIIIRIMTIIVR